MRKLISDLCNIYVKNQFNFEVYDWTKDLFEVFVENNYMTKEPNNSKGSICTYKKTKENDYSFEAKKCRYISANIWEYKNVKNDYVYNFNNGSFLLYPQLNKNAYGNISSSLIYLLLSLQKKEITTEELLSFVDIIEKITSTAIPFGKFTQGDYRYLESEINTACYAHTLEKSKMFLFANSCQNKCHIKELIEDPVNCMYPSFPYFCEIDLPTTATTFSKYREEVIKNLVTLCFCQKQFDIAIDLFIKYKTPFNWNITTLDLCTREAKSAWGLYTPDKYESLIYEYFNNTPLNKLFILQQLVDEHKSLFDLEDIIPKCVYVFKKIFYIIEKETTCVNNEKFIKKVKSLSSNSSLEDLVEIATSQELHTLIDALSYITFEHPEMKSAVKHWLGIYIFEFRDFFLEYSHRHERNYIRDALSKSINERTTKELELLSKQSAKLSENDKEFYVKQFFLSSKDIEEYKSSIHNYSEIYPILNRQLETIINKIKNNNTIYNCIAASQFMLLNSKIDAENESLIIDYSGLVMPQIKLIERYLKEILVQFYPEKIYKIFDKLNCEKIEFKKECYANLTAEDLSGNLDNLASTDNFTSNYFDLGSTSLALQKIYCENKYYKGIFYSKTTPSTYTDFQEKFVKKVRNGYFHIHIVDNYKEALILSQKTAYWFIKCICEAPSDIH